jgi:pimeloyl-ACP methyl ester carboxylesterase
VIWGERDGVMSPRYGEALQAGIARARLQIVPRAGHLPHAEQPAEVAALTRTFLAQAGG